VQLEITAESARRGRLYPSVILHGAEKEARQAAALRLARILLCEASVAERPCGVCRQCSRIVWPGEGDDSFHPDFRILQRDLKTSTSVEATKAFLQLALLAPFEARGQVFVIASAETLTGEAANALLKTLEEPVVHCRSSWAARRAWMKSESKTWPRASPPVWTNSGAREARST
jgi:DNA polymerase III delta prime subunit